MNVCDALKGIVYDSWPGKITSLQFADAKSRSFDKLADIAIEVATASNPFPQWREPLLPQGHPGIWSATMFTKMR
jgi:hypothetical protein